MQSRVLSSSEASEPQQRADPQDIPVGAIAAEVNSSHLIVFKDPSTGENSPGIKPSLSPGFAEVTDPRGPTANSLLIQYHF